MQEFFRQLMVSALALMPLAAEPVINKYGVTNAASYLPQSLSGGGIAQGSRFAVRGKGLGPAGDSAHVNESFPLSYDIDGTSVKVTVNGTSLDAYVMTTSDTEVTAVLPSNAPEGTGTVRLTYNGQSSQPAEIRVVKSSFGIYTLGKFGNGPAAVSTSGSDATAATLTNVAAPGQSLLLSGTGLGAINSADERNAVGNTDGNASVAVYVGGKRAEVTSSNRSRTRAGVDQIAFTVPDVEGCYIPVAVMSGTVVSNFGTISVAKSGKTCTDVNGISGPELESAQASGVYRVGSIDLTRSVSKISIPELGSLNTTSEHGGASFYRYELNKLVTAQGVGGSAVSPGACVVYVSSDIPDGSTPVVNATALDAGPVINVTGPRGAKQLKKQNDGSYSGELSSQTSGLPSGFPSFPGMPGADTTAYLEAGSYTVDNAGGGSDVQGFNVRLTISPLLKWENQDSISSVSKAEGVDITWSGGDPNGYVTLMGISAADKASGFFLCTEKVKAGHFTVPAYALSNLPATTGDSFGFLTVSGATEAVKFNASGLDAGFVSGVSSSQKTVSYR